MNSLANQTGSTATRHAPLWEDTHDLTQITTSDLKDAREICLMCAPESLPSYEQLLDPARPELADAATSSWLAPTLHEVGWHLGDAIIFLGHLGRHHIHASKDRNFRAAYWKRLCSPCQTFPNPNCPTPKCGDVRPRLYAPQKLGDKRYIVLTHPRRSAFVTVDVDLEGTPGGKLENLHPHVLKTINTLTAQGIPPNWGGINTTSGHAQFIWYIDPVYSDEDPTKHHRPTAFLKNLQTDLNRALGGDTAFSHRFLRNPLYSEDGRADSDRYQWHAWHSSIYPMKKLRAEVNTIISQEDNTSTPATTATQTPPKTGWDLIEQAKTRREEAEAKRKEAEAYSKLAKELSGLAPEVADAMDARDPNLRQGVLVIRTETGQVARNQTAFEHALKVATRQRQRGHRLTDDSIIHAFTHAYSVALVEAKDGRPSELPDPKQLTRTAQRIRGYVISNQRKPATPNTGSKATEAPTTHERKVLATFGRRGAKTSNKRRWKDRDSDLAKRSLQPLEEANKKRTFKGVATRARIVEHVAKELADTGTAPTLKELSSSLGVNERTVRRALKGSGIVLPRGRPRTQKQCGHAVSVNGSPRGESRGFNS